MKEILFEQGKWAVELHREDQQTFISIYHYCEDSKLARDYIYTNINIHDPLIHSTLDSRCGICLEETPKYVVALYNLISGDKHPSNGRIAYNSLPVGEFSPGRHFFDRRAT